MNATQKAYDAIREMIIEGVAAPGSPLRESDLAIAIGVSRTPVREALRLLSAGGLAQIHANQGASVAELTRSDAMEVFALRVLLECAVAHEVAGRIDEGAILELEALQDEMERPIEPSAERLSAIARLNRQFHRRICAVVSGSRYAEAALGYIDYPIMLGTFHRYSPNAVARGRQHHRELIEAFRHHDGEWAEAVMRCHILHARSAVIGSFGDDPQKPKRRRNSTSTT